MTIYYFKRVSELLVILFGNQVKGKNECETRESKTSLNLKLIIIQEINTKVSKYENRFVLFKDILLKYV